MSKLWTAWILHPANQNNNGVHSHGIHLLQLREYVYEDKNTNYMLQLNSAYFPEYFLSYFPK